MSNRLAAEHSAYLRSAAHQPIHWFPWSDDAFAAAREQDRPVLLDIGAVWCHWCHVMDGESYEDPRLAGFLNDHFVCIKVDRDERPDVDARYQRAVQALTRQGGWPLTAFLTPSGEVFYGGTYFPPDGAHGRPGFRAVLESVLEAYRSRRGQVQSQAEAVRRVVADDLNEAAPGDVSATMLDEVVAGMGRVFDSVHGGFGRAPKFPHPGAMSLLLHRLWDRRDTTAHTMLHRTLEGMARGGVYDQLGGGFHRYSVDAEWIVPHFEKMSYDNSELLRVYADAYAMFGTELYGATARGIVRWVREVLADPDGGYGASQDADVGLEDDGDYFTWTRDEAAAVLTPAELEVAAACYDIGTAGEMQHNPSKNVLFVTGTPEAIAGRLSRDVGQVQADLERAHAKLLAARNARTAPFVDRTRYTNWNAMMASAMLRAGDVFDDADARDHALRTLARLRDERIATDAVAHTPDGVAGLLDDQVQMASAAVDAHEVTGEAEWLDWAARLMDRVWTDYWDAEAGGLFDTARRRGSEPGLLPARAKPVQDAPTPSPNGVAGMVVARLHEHTGEARWRERGEALIRAFAGRAAELGLYAAAYLLAVDWHLSPVTHLVIVGEPDDPVADRMHAAALATFVPRRVVRRLSPAAANARPLPPAMAGMVAAGTSPRGYACTGTSCRAPAETVEQWTAALAELQPD
jgi:uncharacterized protein YyaL (SSP411 family)